MGRRRFRRLCGVREHLVRVMRTWFFTCVSCGKFKGQYKTTVKIIPLTQLLKQGLWSPGPTQAVNGRCSRCTFSPPPVHEDNHPKSPTQIPSSHAMFKDIGTNYYTDSFCLPNTPEPIQQEPLYKNASQFVFYKSARQTPTQPTLEYASDIFSFGDFYNGRRLIQTLHTGDFGRVGLITVKGHQEKYVLKSFGLQNSDSEVSFLADSQSQFVTKLHGSVNTSCGRLLFLDHYPFGSLDTLTKYGKTVPEKTAVWIIANLYAATDYIHGLGTLHLDINPTNVLIDRHGYPILTDFEKAQKANAKLYPNTMSFAEAYSSPELRTGSQPCKTADYWSIACCLYELLKGRPPVFGGTTDEELALIFLELKKYLTGCSLAAYDFLTTEFHPYAWRRIGRRGISVIVMHQIFDGLCWESIQSGCRSMESPLLELFDSVDHAKSTTNEDRVKTITKYGSSSPIVNLIKPVVRNDQKKDNEFGNANTTVEKKIPTVITHFHKGGWECPWVSDKRLKWT